MDFYLLWCRGKLVCLDLIEVGSRLFYFYFLWLRTNVYVWFLSYTDTVKNYVVAWVKKFIRKWPQSWNNSRKTLWFMQCWFVFHFFKVSPFSYKAYTMFTVAYMSLIVSRLCKYEFYCFTQLKWNIENYVTFSFRIWPLSLTILEYRRKTIPVYNFV